MEPDWAGIAGRSALNGFALTSLETDGRREVAWLPGDLVGEESLAPVMARVFGLRAGEEVGRIVCYRAKELMRALEPSGLIFDGLDLDLAIAGYLADPRLGQATMEAMAAAAPELGADPFGPAPAPRPSASRPGGGAPQQLRFRHRWRQTTQPARTARTRSSRPPSAGPSCSTSLEPSLRKAVAEAGAERLYSEVERPLVRVLAEMELAGIAVDTGKLSEINEELTSEADRLEAEVQRLAGEEFNVNSTTQLRRILFEVKKLTPQKRTKTGFSTDAQSLEKMRGLDPFVDTLLRLPGGGEAQIDLRERTAGRGGARRADPRQLQPDRRPHRPPLVGQAEPAQHPRPQLARPPVPRGVHTWPGSRVARSRL